MSEVPGQDLPPYTPEQQPYGTPGQQPFGQGGQQPFQRGPLSPAELPWRAGTDDNTFALLSHLGAIFFSFIPPLIIFLTKGKVSGYVRDQSLEALNWSITVALAWIVADILTTVTFGIAFILWPIIGIVALVFGILATIAASKGEKYRYPFCLRLIK